MALAGLQGGNEFRHLRLGLLVLLGQQHSGLQGEVPNGNPILLQQMEDQIQRAHKVLGGLRAVPHHTFNVIDRAFHGRHISRESTPV